MNYFLTTVKSQYWHIIQNFFSLLCKRIVTYVERKSSVHHSGFRENKSDFPPEKNIGGNMESQETTWYCFIDFNDAYDSVCGEAVLIQWNIRKYCVNLQDFSGRWWDFQTSGKREWVIVEESKHTKISQAGWSLWSFVVQHSLCLTIRNISVELNGGINNKSVGADGTVITGTSLKNSVGYLVIFK